LLEPGARIEEPDKAIQDAAEYLRAHGLVEFTVVKAVRCSDPSDRDFHYRRDGCKGLIVLDPALDDDGGELACGVCQRIVHARSARKRQFDLMRPRIRATGVMAYLRQLLEDANYTLGHADHTSIKVEGVHKFGLWLHVEDAPGATDSELNRRSHAANLPVVYITTNPRAPAPRLLRDGYVRRIRLLDLVVGAAVIGDVIEDLGRNHAPQPLGSADLPVYAAGPALIQVEAKPVQARQFIVEVRPTCVLIDGAVVINPQGKPRLALFQILWEQFIEDLRAEKCPDEFGAVSVANLQRELAKVRRAQRQLPPAKNAEEDEGAVRKLINNTQNDIAEAVAKQVGHAIGREDIIETVRTASQSDHSGGYRLNPRTVVLRPRSAE